MRSSTPPEPPRRREAAHARHRPVWEPPDALLDSLAVLLLALARRRAPATEAPPAPDNDLLADVVRQ